jgi:hypothetical protein
MRTAWTLAFLPALILVGGCSTTYQPKDFDLDEPWPPLTSTGPVAVRVVEAPLQEQSLALPGETLKFELRDYTRALADRIEEALETQGIAVEPGAGKVIEVEVVYADILTHGRSHCIVDVTLRTADGYVRGHQARAKSGFVKKACNAALSKAALACLSDPQLRAYLSGS